MENIIKKAIDGGYKKERYYFDENGNFDDEPYEVILMKADFWQALGKACGWSEWSGEMGIMSEEEIALWKFYALSFYEINLTQGWDKAVEYLEDLIK